MNLFEFATRNKLRFKAGGLNTLSVEDLWDLPLRGKNSLDAAARHISKLIKEIGEESFVETKTSETKEHEKALEIVKHIISVKLAEEQARKNAAAKLAQKEKIMKILEQKQESELENKSAEELQQMLNEL